MGVSNEGNLDTGQESMILELLKTGNWYRFRKTNWL